MRKWPAAATSSVAPVSAAASLTPSLVPSRPVPLICTVISVASPPRGSFLLSVGRLDAVQRVPDQQLAVIHSGSGSGGIARDGRTHASRDSAPLLARRSREFSVAGVLGMRDKVLCSCSGRRFTGTAGKCCV